MTLPTEKLNAPDLSGLETVLARLADVVRVTVASFKKRNVQGQATLIVVVLVALVAVFSVVSMRASGDILPGVSVAGIRVGGMAPEAAAQALLRSWDSKTLTLRDEQRSWEVAPGELGLAIDADASVRNALAVGREEGGLGAMFGAVFGGQDVEPVIEFNMDVARDAVYRLAEEVRIAPKNATVRLQGVVVTHIDAQPGRKLNVNELLPYLAVDPAGLLDRGDIVLPMVSIAPVITDATPLVAYAQELLERELVMEAYDPVDDTAYPFVLQPNEWGQWLDTRLVMHPTGPRLYLSAAAAPVRAYLAEQSEVLPAPLRLDLGDGVGAFQQAIADGSLNTWVTVRYDPVVHEVARGESAYSISRTIGIPFYLIEQANPDRDLAELYVGDTITLPSRDALLPLRPVRNKRIIVDLSDQYLWAYENGEVVFEWPISSGISSAPTSAGVFQILSHEERAYGSSYTLCDANTCGQWVMHWFMGVYEAVPGLVNGFHGAVELPNGTNLGGGNVGRPYTFGCIMSVNDNALLLYHWADEGVVVEIRN